MSNILGSMIVSLGLDDAKFTQGVTRAEFNAAKAARMATNEARKIERASLQAQKAISDMATQSGQSSKQMANNLRGVPAQFTDIVVSLQGGQAPLTVFLQQGGQLKDMFGGAGNAAKALGGYVVGLVNPFTAAVAGAGLLLYSIQAASTESKELQKSLILTGGASGASLDELRGYAENLGASFGVTQGAASAALGTIVATGSVARDNLEEFTRVAITAESVLGLSIDEIAKNFKKLGEDPVKAAAELDKQLGFLSKATFEQIIAAQQLGETEKAASIAQSAYSAALKSRSEEVSANLGYMEKAWKGLGSAAKESWDAILDIGREASLNDKIKAAETRISNAQALADAARRRGQNVVGGVSPEASKNLDDLREIQKIQRMASDKRAESFAQERKQVAESAKAMKNQDEYLESQKKQLETSKRLTEEQRVRAKLASGEFGPVSESRTKELIKNARQIDLNNPVKASKEVQVKITEADRYLESLKKQLQKTEELTVEETLRADIVAGRLGKLSDEKIKDLTLTAREIDTSKEFAKIEKEFQEVRLDTARATNKARDANEALVQSMLNATPTAKLEEQRRAMQLLAEAFEKGAISAEQFTEASSTYLGLEKVNEKLKESKTLAEELGLSFSSAFEDAIVNGGGFRDMLKGIEKDIIRILARKSVTEPLANSLNGFDLGGVFGKLFSGFGKSDGGGSAGPLSSFSSFSGGGYTGDGARSGGMDGQGGYLAMLHPQESVIDHAKGQTMGGGTSINQSITIDARGADAGVTERIIQAMKQTKAETLAAVQAQANRGGSFARAVGRA